MPLLMSQVNRVVGILGGMLGVLPLALGLSGCFERPGSRGGGNATSSVSSNLETISEDFTPASLSPGTSSTAGLKNQQGQSGDPCAESDDLYDCQPVLLRLYLDMAEMFVDMTQQIVDEVGGRLGSLGDGTSGVETFEGRTIHYSKSSATDFSILMEDTGPVAYFDINGTVYTLQMDLDNLEEADDASGKLEVVVNYEADDSWSIEIFILEMDCDSSDPRAPERIHIRVARSGALWKGKAMFYNGRWLSRTASCSVAESDEESMNIYTDFVASETAAKASVYMMSRAKDDLADIADFGMDQFPINFSGGGDDNTSDYKNPFCNPASTLDALWDNDCASIDTNVSSADYGPASDWIVPSEFYRETVTLPTSLSD